MRVIFVSHGSKQTAITVELLGYEHPYETHLFNDNGHTERHSISHSLEDALSCHRYLCEKCDIRVNV